MSDIQITLEQSREYAAIITMINGLAFSLDENYLLEAARLTREQAQRYDSMSVLIPTYTPAKSELYSLQAQCLQHLAQFIATSKHITIKRAELGLITEQQQQIDNMLP